MLVQAHCGTLNHTRSVEISRSGTYSMNMATIANKERNMYMKGSRCNMRLLLFEMKVQALV